MDREQETGVQLCPEMHLTLYLGTLYKRVRGIWVVLFVNFSKVIILQTTICITLFYLLTRREYAPPIINNYPAKSRGISPDELSRRGRRPSWLKSGDIPQD